MARSQYNVTRTFVKRYLAALLRGSSLSKSQIKNLIYLKKGKISPDKIKHLLKISDLVKLSKLNFKKLLLEQIDLPNTIQKGITKSIDKLRFTLESSVNSLHKVSYLHNKSSPYFVNPVHSYRTLSGNYKVFLKKIPIFINKIKKKDKQYLQKLGKLTEKLKHSNFKQTYIIFNKLGKLLSFSFKIDRTFENKNVDYEEKGISPPTAIVNYKSLIYE